MLFDIRIDDDSWVCKSRFDTCAASISHVIWLLPLYFGLGWRSYRARKRDRRRSIIVIGRLVFVFVCVFVRCWVIFDLVIVMNLVNRFHPILWKSVPDSLPDPRVNWRATTGFSLELWIRLKETGFEPTSTMAFRACVIMWFVLVERHAKILLHACSGPRVRIWVRVGVRVSVKNILDRNDVKKIRERHTTLCWVTVVVMWSARFIFTSFRF